METTERIKVDINNYENFWSMLNSSDEGNAVVALSILENADFRESLPYILLLVKSQDGSGRQLWLNNASKLTKKIETLGINLGTSLSYKVIIEIIKDKCSTEATQFVIDKFTIILTKYLIKWGFDFVKDLDVKLTLKK